MEVFLTGLKEEISIEVRLHEPKNMMEAMVKAQRVEDKNRILGKLLVGNGKWSNLQKNVHLGQKWVSDWQPANNKVTNLQNVVKTRTSGWKGRRTFHNWSPVKVNEKMRKGEYFICEEKYNPTHVCKNR